MMAMKDFRDYRGLFDEIKTWALALGFSAVSVSRPEIPEEKKARVSAWLASGFHGEMSFLERNQEIRNDPRLLHAGTLSILSFQLPYLSAPLKEAQGVLDDPTRAYVSRYALGRDYHKVMRQKLKRLQQKMAQEFGEFSARICTDSAPIYEVELAHLSGLGWKGKHTLLIDRARGSMFFLGEMLTDLPLEPTEQGASHCGSCTRCLQVCPTAAIIAPETVDARRCISYLTIEFAGSIPIEFREKMGNRIYGCDDCQLFCPWNRFAVLSHEVDFAVRNGLDAPELLQLFSWSEEDFMKNFAGSAIYRIGFERWQRNLAVALGNAPVSDAILQALSAHHSSSELVREHVAWAIEQQTRKQT